MNMDEQKVIERINAVGANKACQRCGKNEFTLLEGSTQLPLDIHRGSTIIFGGNRIPCAIIVCNNCGCLNIHALGVLDNES